jgi:C1A family cysteine protease
MNEKVKRKCNGWLPDYPDIRDYTVSHDKVKPLLKKAGVLKADRTALPKKADLRRWCSPVEDQGELGSCTAQAGAGMAEYFQRKAYGKHLDASRLFLYKVTRNLMQQAGDSGAYLRTTMGALTLFGVPPEEYWPYDVARFDEEPPAFCYSFAQNYQSVKYLRLDPPGSEAGGLLAQIKSNLAAEMPAMFGFTCYSSIESAGDGKIPYPEPRESVVGGHAVIAVGYDDDLKITNPYGRKATTGALLIRNSWGEGWGETGYGWLPYDYVLRGLAVDWWTLISAEWIDTGEFKL